MAFVDKEKNSYEIHIWLDDACSLLRLFFAHQFYLFIENCQVSSLVHCKHNAKNGNINIQIYGNICLN